MLLASRAIFSRYKPQSSGLLCVRRVVTATDGAITTSKNDNNAASRLVPTVESLLRGDMIHFYGDIQQVLSSTQPELNEIARYYFTGSGKAVRPLVTLCLARAINSHLNENCSTVMARQREVAQIIEMVHNTSLIHDDVIDAADTRRGQPSVAFRWGQNKSVLAGVFALGIICTKAARIGNQQVLDLIFRGMADLVKGELIQLLADNKEMGEMERFSVYIDKTFRKTASLIAHSCQAVSVLSGADAELQKVAFEFGRHLGMAFQLTDDMLDFDATSKQLGKPAAADLHLGLATAPVLFAAQTFPELNSLIENRFRGAGDAKRAFELVRLSNGIEQTRKLADQHSRKAVHQLTHLNPSLFRQALITLINRLLQRTE